jgi:hypothetical protein
MHPMALLRPRYNTKKDYHTQPAQSDIGCFAAEPRSYAFQGTPTTQGRGHRPTTAAGWSAMGFGGAVATSPGPLGAPAKIDGRRSELVSPYYTGRYTGKASGRTVGRKGDTLHGHCNGTAKAFFLHRCYTVAFPL